MLRLHRQLKEIFLLIKNKIKPKFYSSHRARSGESKTILLQESLLNKAKEGLKEKDWNTESAIFKDKEYEKNKSYWRLDFAKKNISIEVAFNHQKAVDEVLKLREMLNG